MISLEHDAAAPADPSRSEELAEVLSAPAEPRPIGYLAVLGLAVLGLWIGLWVPWSVAGMRADPLPALEPPAHPGQLREAIAAFRAGLWDVADRRFARLASAPNRRVFDYLDRIALAKRDQQRMALAEDALERGEPTQASAIAREILPNSPYYAASEALRRRAQAQTAASAGEPRVLP